ncbi:hypothetical protein B0H17DRAFT_1051326 [Mycena rosella]|uniref:Uncharacterized protein n=1 Tax=Mycena rosella TaxID=1033263 RepID=A0AAD7DS81_MYCRO|nr:hypothetical protein B0H17DRAFT_1051326 [Mycena rosella]
MLDISVFCGQSISGRPFLVSVPPAPMPDISIFCRQSISGRSFLASVPPAPIHHLCH